MSELKPCPFCGRVPEIGYACGEYFIMSEDDACPCCGIEYSEMHSNEVIMVEAWNRRADNERKTD